MPTGYTEDIEKGITFERYALGCARAFGACVMQRDDNTDALPALQEPSYFYQKELKKARTELNEVLGYSINECDKLALKERTDSIENEQKQAKEKADLKEKYESMLDKVREWEPPTSDHDGLKSFMIEQINGSIDFDTNHNPEYWIKPFKTGSEWKTDKIEKLQDDVKRYSEKWDEERQRTKDRNKWITDLYESLGCMDKLNKENTDGNI